MKLPRWLVVVMLSASTISVLGSAAWWWVVWPDRTAAEFAALLKAGQGEAALGMIREPRDLLRAEFEKARFVPEEGAPEHEPRSVADVLRGKQRFKIAISSWIFEAQFGKVTASPPLNSAPLQFLISAAQLQTVQFSPDGQTLANSYAGLTVVTDRSAIVGEPTTNIGSGDNDVINSDPRLAIIGAAPDFELVDQSSRSWRSADGKGKVLLVSFIFTTCNGSCPATTHRMSLVQQELKSRGLLKDGRVQLISITFDPARDTPEVLARYMRLYDADPEHWSFLTGSPEDVQKTIAAWGMWVRPAANGQLDHPSRIFLVDQNGKVREIYNLSFLKPAWAADDVKLLLDETQPATGDR